MLSKVKEKEKSIELRKQGLSYKEITERTGVGKGTLSNWLSTIEIPPEGTKTLLENRKLHRINIGKAGAEGVRKKHQKIRQEMLNEEIENFSNIKITQEALALIGASLYWAEGTKPSKIHIDFSFSNSDPEMIKIFMRWAREILKVEENEFHIRINCYTNNGLTYEEIQKFWIEKTGIPKEQFIKPGLNITPSSSREGKRTLPLGTIHIKIRNALRYAAKYTALAQKMGIDTDPFVYKKKRTGG